MDDAVLCTQSALPLPRSGSRQCIRTVERLARDDHGCRGREYWIAFELNGDRDRDSSQLHAGRMRDVTQVIAETAANRECQELGPVEPEAASPAFPSGRSTTTV